MAVYVDVKRATRPGLDSGNHLPGGFGVNRPDADGAKPTGIRRRGVSAGVDTPAIGAWMIGSSISNLRSNGTKGPSFGHHRETFKSASRHIRASPSFPAAMMLPDSGTNRRFKIAPVEPRNAAISFLLSRSQIRTIWSSPVAAN
jgi:hypothetical protein